MSDHFDFEIKFNGTEDQFYEFLNNFNIKRTYLSRDPYRWTPDFERLPYKRFGLVYLWDQVANHKILSFIKIQTLPEKKTLLIIHLSKIDGQKGLYWWSVLQEELFKQGWLIDQINLKKPDVKTATNHDWLDYYHAMIFSGHRYTLKDLSLDMRINYDNVRKLHMGCPFCMKSKKGLLDS